MPLLPLYGHATLRDRFDDAIRRDSLPGSLLLHGPLGIGKQRLALWLGQRLLCTGSGPLPCGSCQHCRYALSGMHPDIHWYFPRPSVKGGGSTPAKVNDDFREASAERSKTGAYLPSLPGEGIHVATIQAMVQAAAVTPGLGSRGIFVIGVADRMVLREGAEDSAGALLKLLEEPPAWANIILTTSEPGALIPTIRSRVVAVRVAPLGVRDVDAVLAEPAIQVLIDEVGGPNSVAEQRRVAAGAPGVLLARAEWAVGIDRARQIIAATSTGNRREQMRTSIIQGSSRARGTFTTSLEALTWLLHERLHEAAMGGDNRTAVRSARALDAVEAAKERAAANVNPQLITSELLLQLHGYLA